MWKEIQNAGLLEMVHDTSSFLKIELGNIVKERGIIENVRGNGTAIAFDLNVETESMMSWLHKRGILVARTGPKTLALRPSLVLGPYQAKHLREALKYFNDQHDKRRY
jgi:acetylornithine/succinyldiaminopimelate/putrescine aminotransferase